MELNFFNILFYASTIIILFALIFIARMKNKKQIHYIFISLLVFAFIWSLGLFLDAFERNLYNYNGLIYINISFIGAALSPILLLLAGQIFARTKIDFSWKYYFLFLIPVITIILVWTNSLHKLVYVEYSSYSNEIIYGRYYFVHVAYSYVCVFLGLYYFIYYSLKNSGFFSKQLFLIVIGTASSLFVNAIYTFNLVEVPVYITSTVFSFAVVCIIFAIFKFDFLNIVPIALQRIVDIISDSFIVVDEEYNIIDFNKTFINTFSNIIRVRRKDSIIEALSNSRPLNIEIESLLSYLEQAVSGKESVFFEKQIIGNDFDKYFAVEITPIYSEDKWKQAKQKVKLVRKKNKANLIGIIILLKDITEHKKNIQALKENQAILLEQERLASLGQLIGGIAHNLKTPIMSISGGIEALKDLTFEYRDSIDDKSVTEEDHKEIAKEMLSWLDRIKPYCSYMSDVISAVKGQAVQMNASTTVKFTVDELVKRVDLLLKHELKKYHCLLKLISQIDMSTEIKGEVNNLVQVFDNIIINAMQAYEGKNGTIDLTIVRSGDNVEFTFKDYGKGIPKQIADKLFKEMITTKGKNGTGLGLYMSYSTIKGRFGGNMSFTSKEGVGTTFFISVPCITYTNREAG